MRVFTGEDLMLNEGDSVYKVELFLRNRTKGVKGTAYIYGDYVYPYRGRVVDKSETKSVGMYELYTEEPRKFPEYIFKEPETEIDQKVFSVDSVVDLDYNVIIDNITKNSDRYISPEYLEYVNSSTDIFIPEIKDEDDFLKKLIKKAIIAKKINLNNYKDKLENKWSLTNLKSSLTKDSNMTMKYFIMWCELLGMDCDITLKDNGEDRIRPLEKEVSLSLSNELYTK